MLQAIGILLVFQLIGEVISQVLRLPVPGPVVGMALLLIAMALAPGLARQLRDTAGALLQHLSLLFVPAGVGVMLHARRLADDGVAIAAALVLGTLITLVVTAVVTKACTRLFGAADTGDEA
jgi:holin-like protein